jgi:hypothetical protein
MALILLWDWLKGIFQNSTSEGLITGATRRLASRFIQMIFSGLPFLIKLKG